MTGITRKVSLHERSFIARHNVGAPSILSILVTYHDGNQLPSHDFLAKRIQELEEHYPLLSSDLIDPKTANPKFELRSQKWGSNSILRAENYVQDPRKSKEQVQEDLLLREIKRMEGESLDTKPLWQVTTFTTPASQAYICLSMNHILTDGQGLLRILNALLDNSIAHHPYEKLPEVTRFEDTVDLSPLQVSTQGISNPDTWPQKVPSQPLLEAPSSTLAISIPQQTVDTIKALAKGHAVSTLHPVFTTVSLIALRQLIKGESEMYPLTLYSARAERAVEELGHGYCTGIYVGGTIHRTEPFEDSKDFWGLVQAVSETLDSPQAQDVVRRKVGALGLIPNEVPEGNIDPRVTTGWEYHVLNSVNTNFPFATSLFVSNLTYSALPENAEDMTWSQTASISLAPITFNMLGHEKGSRMTLGWRDKATIGRPQAEQVVEVYRRVLSKLASSEDGLPSVGDLTAQ